eukprot:7023161-Prymnesium_polylepis.2
MGLLGCAANARQRPPAGYPHFGQNRAILVHSPGAPRDAVRLCIEFNAIQPTYSLKKSRPEATRAACRSARADILIAHDDNDWLRWLLVASRAARRSDGSYWA